MKIANKEFGFVYDQGAIIELCEILGLTEDVGELSNVFSKAFEPFMGLKEGDIPKVSVAFLKISNALIFVCANRWADRNNKDYRLSLNDIYDEPQEVISEALKSVYEVLLNVTPKGNTKKKGLVK